MNTMTQKEYIAEARRRMQGFQFRELANTSTFQAWECSKPGSSSYAFQIAMGRMGISVFGDIQGMLFKVGSSYGIDFLAGDDVSYYIHSKLDPQCKKTVFNEKYFNEIVYKGLVRAFSAEFADDDSLPDWVHEIDPPMDKGEELKALVRAKAEAGDHEAFLQKFREVVADAAQISNCNDAFHFLHENEEFLCESDVWEYDFQTVCPELLQRLYMVNVAAQEIVKMRPQHQEDDSQVESATNAPGC